MYNYRDCTSTCEMAVGLATMMSDFLKLSSDYSSVVSELWGSCELWIPLCKCDRYNV